MPVSSDRVLKLCRVLKGLKGRENLSLADYLAAIPRLGALGDVPSGINAVANFFGAISQDVTVTLDAPFSVRAVSFDSPHSYTLAGDFLTITTGAASIFGNIAVNQGSHVIAAPILLDRSTDVFITAGNNLTISSDIFAEAGVRLTKVGAGTLETKALQIDELAVSAGTLKITEGTGETTVQNVFSVAATARLDLTNNNLTAVGGNLATISARVASGYNGGAWNGPGRNRPPSGCSSSPTPRPRPCEMHRVAGQR